MSVTLSDTCGLRNAMIAYFPSATALAVALTSLEAVRPEIVGGRAKSLIVGLVIDCLALVASRDDPSANQAIQMMVQGGPWDLELALEVGDRDAFGTALDDGAKERQTGRMAQCAQLQSMLFKPYHID